MKEFQHHIDNRRKSPDCPAEPLPKPVCTRTPLCAGCPYVAHGFVCWGKEECMRSRVNKIVQIEEQE